MPKVALFSVSTVTLLIEKADGGHLVLRGYKPLAAADYDLGVLTFGWMLLIRCHFCARILATSQPIFALQVFSQHISLKTSYRAYIATQSTWSPVGGFLVCVRLSLRPTDPAWLI